MKPNEVVGLALVIVGALIIVIKFLADIGWIKLPEKPKKQELSTWEKFLEIILELIKKGQTAFAVGFLRNIFGGSILVWSNCNRRKRQWRY